MRQADGNSIETYIISPLYAQEVNMKSNRHEKILEIIKNYDVETQEELIIRLKENGYNVTQATVSRDIRDLRLTKTMDAAGNYKYTLPTSALRKADVYSETLARSIKKAAIASNLIVVHTYSGMAQAVAAGVDSHDSDEILGCVAGDDTILIVLEDAEKASAYFEKINSLIK